VADSIEKVAPVAIVADSRPPACVCLHANWAECSRTYRKPSCQADAPILRTPRTSLSISCFLTPSINTKDRQFTTHRTSSSNRWTQPAANSTDSLPNHRS